jgi:hypothetical protein
MPCELEHYCESRSNKQDLTSKGYFPHSTFIINNRYNLHQTYLFSVNITTEFSSGLAVAKRRQGRPLECPASHRYSKSTLT